MFPYLRVVLVSGGVGWGESAPKFRGYTESVPRTCPVYFLEISRTRISMFNRLLSLCLLHIRGVPLPEFIVPEYGLGESEPFV